MSSRCRISRKVVTSETFKQESDTEWVDSNTATETCMSDPGRRIAKTGEDGVMP